MELKRPVLLLAQSDRISDSCKLIISGPCSLISVTQFYGVFRFSFQSTIKIQKRKTAIATNIFIMVYKNHIFEHIHMVYNVIIVSKVANQWSLTLASLQVNIVKVLCLL